MNSCSLPVISWGHRVVGAAVTGDRIGTDIEIPISGRQDGQQANAARCHLQLELRNLNAKPNAIFQMVHSHHTLD